MHVSVRRVGVERQEVVRLGEVIVLDGRGIELGVLAVNVHAVDAELLEVRVDCDGRRDGGEEWIIRINLDRKVFPFEPHVDEVRHRPALVRFERNPLPFVDIAVEAGGLPSCLVLRDVVHSMVAAVVGGLDVRQHRLGGLLDL